MAAGTEQVVLATKLLPPRARDAVVLRERLLARLRLGLRCPLTLVVAPAGWGKSTLVGDWLRQDGIGGGWLSLDPVDDDAMRFWRYLLLAVQRPDPRLGTHALRRLDAAGSDLLVDVVPAFVNDVLAWGERLVVVLDDYHVITNPRIHASLNLLLDHCPDNLHVVIPSRTDPPLRLSRLRVRQQLVELRAEHLRFTGAEAGELLNDRMGLGLTRQDVERLLARTEGWAAGLQLAALRLREVSDPASFIEAFTGANRHVVDYLGEEVLDGQPPRVRDFLLQTSVLDRFSGPLCDAVTGARDSAQILAEVLRANLFVIALDDEQRWFRYHHLFAEQLRFQLRRTSPALVPHLQRQAARWHAEQGDLGEAIEYALRAGAYDLASHLVAAQWRRHFNAGQWSTVHRWLSALPDRHVAADPALSVARAWIALDNGRLEEALAVLDTAGRAAAADVHLRLLRAQLLFKLGDLGAAGDQLAAVGQTADDTFAETVRRLVTGLVALWSADLDTADAQLSATARIAADDGNRLAQIYALGCGALLLCFRGDLVGARQLIEESEALVTDSLSDRHFIAMFPALARARLALQEPAAGDPVALAARAVALARGGAGRGELAAALLTAAQAHRTSAGAADGPQAAQRQATAYLVQARSTLHECADPGPVLGSWLAGEQRETPRTTPSLVGPLTERELAILRLLPGTASVGELAAALFVTPNTLKTHLKAVYRKLGARSRADAVLRAREHGLL